MTQIPARFVALVVFPLETHMPPNHTPAPASPSKTLLSWEEILREIQRVWSEMYQEERPEPLAVPVPVPSPRQPGC